MQKGIHSLARKVRKALNKQFVPQPTPQPKPNELTLEKICQVLGMPAPEGPNPSYTVVDFAIGMEPGGVAIISDVTSTRDFCTPEKRCEELADIAMRDGAALLIGKKQYKDYPCLIVESPFDAFAKIIAYIRSQFNPMVVSVTGSIGKTTTAAMIHTMLSHRFNTYGSVKNANSARYSAKRIQQLTHEVEAYVQEIAEGPPFGAASAISRIVQPQAAVVTRIGTSHLEAFETQDRILESCLGIQDGMPVDGLLVLNGDDPFQRNAGELCRRNTVYYGIDENADYRAVNIRGEEDSLCFDVQHDGTVTPVRIRCFGRYNIYNALAAFAVGKWAGMEDQEIAEGLYEFHTTGIRQNLVRVGGYRLFMDCYNASSESMESAFSALETIPVGENGRRIAVLADIKETGGADQEIHEAVGALAAEYPIDLLMCYGKSSIWTAREARKHTDIRILRSSYPGEMTRILQKNIREEDVVLFKGSRAMALEQLVDRIFGTWFYESDEQYVKQAHETDEGPLRFLVFPDHAVVIAKTNEEPDVAIPESVEGLPVTGVDESAFSQSHTNTQSVRFPETLRSIRTNAFARNSELTTVSIPGSVLILGEGAFSLCEKLESVTVASGCMHIGRFAFMNCEGLKTIDIPESVHFIGEDAFMNCPLLTIRGEKGSLAERYAKEHEIRFQEH